jgi:hypothetical protein
MWKNSGQSGTWAFGLDEDDLAPQAGGIRNGRYF